MIKGIIFDLDGTLIDSMGIWHKIDVEFLDKRNIQLTDELSFLVNGMSFREMAVYFKEKFNLTDDIDSIMNEWMQMAEYHYMHDIPLKPFAIEILDELKTLEIKMGLGTSNKQPLVNAVLNRLGIYKYFDVVLTSDEVQVGKPNPTLFLTIARKLGFTHNSILVVEDSFAGVMAAKNANMLICAVEDEHAKQQKDKIKENSDFFVSNLQECCEIIKSFIG